MKGQASLEMVIGLIILLVVAAVVISLVIFYINPTKIKTPEEELNKNEFINSCKDWCKDTNSLEYCRAYFPGTDWNQNGVKNEMVQVGTYEWDTCEKRVYCFLAVPCDDRFGTGLDAIQKCKQVLCQAYREKYGVDATATAALQDSINIGECDFTSVAVADMWYDRVGFGAGDACVQ